MNYKVQFGYNAAEGRYYVIESEIHGLRVEANKFEEFVESAKQIVPVLLGSQVRDAKIELYYEVPLAN